MDRDRARTSLTSRATEAVSKTCGEFVRRRAVREATGVPAQPVEAALRTLIGLTLLATAAGADLVPAVRKAFRGKEPESRVAALEALDATDASDRRDRNRVAAAIEKAIKKEESPRVRIAALGLLYRLGTERALDRVLVGIVDPAPPVREWVRALVRDRPDARLHGAVIRAMKDDASWRFRASMIDLLLEARWSTTRRALVAALDDEHIAVSARAAEALERLTGQSFGTDRKKWIAHFEDEALRKARETGRTVAPLPEKIDVSDKPVRGLTPLLYTIPVREKNLVFVVDMSSSMNKTSRSSHFTQLIEAIFALPSDASFNILCFDQRLFFFAKAKSLVAATTANKAAAERWIHGLPAGERTDVMQSMTTGLAMLREALRRDAGGRAEIFILTDGRETVKTTSLTRVEAAYQKLPVERCRIHVVALGRAGSPVLRALAERSGGRFAEAPGG